MILRTLITESSQTMGHLEPYLRKIKKKIIADISKMAQFLLTEHIKSDVFCFKTS